MKRILRFTASWCGPCKALAETVKTINSIVPFEAYDIDENMEMAIDYGIRSVPTLVMMDGNTEMKRTIGLMSKDELLKWIDEE